MDNEVIGLDNEAIETQGAATVPKGYRGPKAFRALRHRNFQLFFAGQLTGMDLSYSRWMIGAIVPGVISLTVVPLMIYRLFPPEIKRTPLASTMAADELAKMGPIERSEKLMLLVFALVALLWIPVAIGAHRLYAWSRPEEFQHNEHLIHTLQYLSLRFFILRAVPLPPVTPDSVLGRRLVSLANRLERVTVTANGTAECLKLCQSR